MGGCGCRWVCCKVSAHLSSVEMEGHVQLSLSLSLSKINERHTHTRARTNTFHCAQTGHLEVHVLTAPARASLIDLEQCIHNTHTHFIVHRSKRGARADCPCTCLLPTGLEQCTHSHTTHTHFIVHRSFRGARAHRSRTRLLPARESV